MTWCMYDSVVAFDEPSGGIARNAAGQVFARTDTARANPLSVTDLAGNPLLTLTTSSQGFIPAFLVEDHLEVVWVSGPYEIPLLSFTGIIERVMAAQAAAIEAAEAAVIAADRSALPAGGTPGDVVTRTADGSVWAPPPSSTGGISGAPATWPPKFPSESHSHPIADLRKSDEPLASFVLQLLGALDKAAARAAIGAGTGNGTSDLTLGYLPSQAMPGNRQFTAAEIGVATGTGLSADDVQEALTELKNLIGSGGGGGAALAGTLVVRRHASGAYPVRGTLPAGITVLWVGPVPPTSGGLYAVAGTDLYLATAA